MVTNAVARCYKYCICLLLLWGFSYTKSLAQGHDFRYNKAVEYFNQGSLQSAFDLAVAMKTDAEANYPTGSSKQFDAVQLIALIMTQAAVYDQCELLLNDYIPIWSEGSAENLKLKYCTIENFRLWGRIAEGLLVAEEVLNTYRSQGIQSMDYYNTLNSYGLLCYDYGRYLDAENALLACKTFYGQNMMLYEDQYQRENNNLGMLYTNWNRLQEAESLLKECLEYRKLTYGEDAPMVATTLNNLGSVYSGQFDYAKAYRTYERAYYIRAKLYGKNHSLTIQCVNNMATAAYSSQDYTTADSLITIVVREWKADLGEESSDYLTALNTYASIKMEANDLDTARILLEQIYTTRKMLFGNQAFVLSQSLGALTELEYRSKNFEAAADYALKNYELCAGYFTENAAEAFDLLLQAAQSFEKANQLEKSDSLIIIWYARALADLSVFIGAGSGEVNSTFLLARKVQFSSAAAYTKRNHARNPTLFETTLNAELNFRNWQLYSLSRWDDLISSQKNKELDKLYMDWKDMRLTYGDMLQFGSQNLDEKAKMLQEMRSLEIRIKQSIPDASSLFSLTNYRDIAKQLKPHQLCIQIIYQAAYDELNDSLINRTYEAIAFNNKAELSWITICDASKIENWYETTTTFIDRSWAYRGAEDLTEEKAEDTTSTKFLNNLVWEPLKEMAQNYSELIYAPDGVFSLISLSSIPTSDSTYVIDNYTLLPVTSLINVIEKHKKLSNKTVLLYGGIDYNNMNSEIIKSKYTVENIEPELDKKDGFSYLKGTKKELDELTKLFQKNKLNTITRSGKYCTEEQFYTDVLQQPRILHMATHGFYISKKNQANLQGLEITMNASNKFDLARDPLMRSGLVLAGGNETWNNESDQNNALNDGILTAYDLAQQDLSNTELVILSACETALGDITYGQGVFGLQTAIKRAGADYMIIALWKISDEATVEFAEYFYTNWLKVQNIELAFTEAQLFMRKKYPVYIWAAFQLVK